MPKSRFNVTNMSFNAIHKNRILGKISEFTVLLCTPLSTATVFMNNKKKQPTFV